MTITIENEELRIKRESLRQLTDKQGQTQIQIQITYNKTFESDGKTLLLFSFLFLYLLFFYFIIYAFLFFICFIWLCVSLSQPGLSWISKLRLHAVLSCPLCCPARWPARMRSASCFSARHLLHISQAAHSVRPSLRVAFHQSSPNVPVLPDGAPMFQPWFQARVNLGEKPVNTVEETDMHAAHALHMLAHSHKSYKGILCALRNDFEGTTRRSVHNHYRLLAHHEPAL